MREGEQEKLTQMWLFDKDVETSATVYLSGTVQQHGSTESGKTVTGADGYPLNNIER